jgi:hypothetical protein
MPDGTSEKEGCAVVSEAVSSKTRHHLLRGTPGRARSAGIINPCDALLLSMMRHCTQARRVDRREGISRLRKSTINSISK